MQAGDYLAVIPQPAELQETPAKNEVSHLQKPTHGLSTFAPANSQISEEHESISELSSPAFKLKKKYEHGSSQKILAEPRVIPTQQPFSTNSINSLESAECFNEPEVNYVNNRVVSGSAASSPSGLELRANSSFKHIFPPFVHTTAPSRALNSDMQQLLTHVRATLSDLERKTTKIMPFSQSRVTVLESKKSFVDNLICETADGRV